MEGQLGEALKVLGIPADSDRETVTSAYRRLARATHPDVSPDPDAAERFATVTAAYRLVSGALDPGLGEREDFADIWTTPASDLGGAHLLLGVPPFGPARIWRHPPIVAGPVVVCRVQPDAGTRSANG